MLSNFNFCEQTVFGTIIQMKPIQRYFHIYCFFFEMQDV